MINSKDAKKIALGEHCDPFSVLGLHEVAGKLFVRAFMPQASKIEVLDYKTKRAIASLSPIAHALGVFEGQVTGLNKGGAYLLRISKDEHQWICEDPYRFGPVLGELDEHLIAEGEHLALWSVLGAHVMTHEGVQGTHFSLWAANARRVSIVGDFNGWDGRRNVMRKRGQCGVWEIFLPNIGEGEPYKFELHDANGHLLPQKADPFGFGSEHPPKTASVVRKLDGYQWGDKSWMEKREVLNRIDQPISIYEVHLGSWRRVVCEDNRRLSYLELARELVAYVKDMGFTHIELMPISEFPFDGSWGYQPVGLYAPTSRHGTVNQFRAFVEACHGSDIGLLLDWVPGHFPEDKHGLGLFDGTPVYEHSDRREGFHPDWNTLVYNLLIHDDNDNK